MEILNKWPHKWFGVWKEYGEQYSKCPSIKEFIQDRNLYGDKIQLISKYLATSQIIGTTSKHCFPDPISCKVVFGDISFRTDGIWVWLDDLADYIVKYNVAIPVLFYRNIEANNFEPITNWQGDYKKLDWPKL